MLRIQVPLAFTARVSLFSWLAATLLVPILAAVRYSTFQYVPSDYPGLPPGYRWSSTGIYATDRIIDVFAGLIVFGFVVGVVSVWRSRTSQLPRSRWFFAVAALPIATFYLFTLLPDQYFGIELHLL